MCILVSLAGSLFLGDSLLGKVRLRLNPRRRAWQKDCLTNGYAIWGFFQYPRKRFCNRNDRELFCERELKRPLLITPRIFRRCTGVFLFASSEDARRLCIFRRCEVTCKHTVHIPETLETLINNFTLLSKHEPNGRPRRHRNPCRP